MSAFSTQPRSGSLFFPSLRHEKTDPAHWFQPSFSLELKLSIQFYEWSVPSDLWVNPALCGRQTVKITTSKYDLNWNGRLPLQRTGSTLFIKPLSIHGTYPFSLLSLSCLNLQSGRVHASPYLHALPADWTDGFSSGLGVGSSNYETLLSLRLVRFR